MTCKEGREDEELRRETAYWKGMMYERDMSDCRNVLSDDKAEEISEVKKAHVIHSHTKTCVCMLCPLIVSSSEEFVREEGVTMNGMMRRGGEL